MSGYSLVTARDATAFRRLVEDMPRRTGPHYLLHDRCVARYWQSLDRTFPDHQLCLVDDHTGGAVGIGRGIPLALDGSWSELPSEGLDWALEKGFVDHQAGRTPNAVSALYIEIAATHRGRRLSQRILTAMLRHAGSMGYRHLVAPVRPSLKSRYPLIDIDTYLSWTTPTGSPFDPWLRVHVQTGARVLHVCRRAMLISGTRNEWAEWTEMELPGDGEYIIPDGLVPLRIQSDVGEYIEPGIWVLHDVPES